MPAKKTSQRWKWITASVLITLTAAVPLSTFILPPIHRWYMLEKLVSDDPEVRLEGQKYVIGFAPEKPEVLAGAIERLDAAEGVAFYELVWTIDNIGFWDRAHIGADAWLRWLEWIASDDDAQARVLAVQMIADVPDLALAERASKIVTQLAADPSPDVRYNAMVACAEMIGIAQTENNAAATDRFVAVIQKLTADRSPIVARQAWMFCGLLKQLPAKPEVHEEAFSADVMGAKLWAESQVDIPQWPGRANAAFMLSPHPEDPAMAAYLLAQTASDFTRQFTDTMEKGPAAVNSKNQRIMWRAILGLETRGNQPLLDPESGVQLGDSTFTKAEFDHLSRHRSAISAFLASTTPEQLRDDPNLRPVILTAIVRDEGRILFGLGLLEELSDFKEKLFGPEATPRVVDEFKIFRSGFEDPLFQLALLESLNPKPGDSVSLGIGWKFDEQTPEMIRVAMLRQAPTESDNLQQFMPLFLSESPEIRDLACITAAKKLSTEQCARIVRALWRRPRADDSSDQPVYLYNDHAKISGAILAGLTGVEPDAIDLMAIDFSDRWLVRDMMRLGQWMQGRAIAGPNTDSYMNNLLLRDDVPRSSILLGMLHRRPDLALDYLLTPRGDLNADLVTLLEQFRWWYVLKEFLPETAPTIELWGDPDLIAFQVDLLRNWYALNRYRIAKESGKNN